MRRLWKAREGVWFHECYDIRPWLLAVPGRRIAGTRSRDAAGLRWSGKGGMAEPYKGAVAHAATVEMPEHEGIGDRLPCKTQAEPHPPHGRAGRDYLVMGCIILNSRWGISICDRCFVIMQFPLLFSKISNSLGGD